MNERYLDIGAVSDLPEALAQCFMDLGAAFDQTPLFKRRKGLAGPNDILDVIMSADLWGLSVPWAMKTLAQGGIAFLGGQIAAKFVTSKTDKKIAEISDKLDRLMEQVDQNRTAWGAQWELSFGLRGSRIEQSRATIATPIRSREEAAQAVIMLALLGDEVERIVNIFWESNPPKEGEIDKAFATGVPTFSRDGSVSVILDLICFPIKEKIFVEVSPDGKISVKNVDY